MELRRRSALPILLLLSLFVAVPTTAAAESFFPSGSPAPRAPSSAVASRGANAPTPIDFELDDAFSPTVGGAISVAVGDVTGDGLDDLLVGNDASPCPCPIDLYEQLPDGSLEDPVTLATTEEVNSDDSGIAIGDLDDDDDLDVAVATSDGVDWFEQEGGGLLDAVHLDEPASGGEQVAIADLDGDGLNDIVEIGEQLDVWRNGDTGFTVETLAPRFVEELEVGDVTGDGAPDIVLGNASQIEVWENENDGTGGFRTPDTYPTSSSVNAITLGDGNDDGRTDVMAVVGGNASSKMNFFRQTTAGALAARVVYESKDIPDSADVADLNRDGRDDLIVGHGTWVTFGVYLQLPDGTFAREKLYPTGYHNIEQKGIATGDVNDDGRLDVVFGDFTGMVHVWRQARALSISAPRKVGFGSDLEWTARLARPGTTVNKVLSVYRMVNGAPHLLDSGTVDGKGRLTGTLRNVRRNVVLRVEWDGDTRSAFTAATTRVGVPVVAAGVLRGSYGRAGQYHLFHAGDRPTYVGSVTPNHSGKQLGFTLQRRSPGGWSAVSATSVEMGPKGTATVSIRGLRSRTDYRVRCWFYADKDHLGDKAAWSYIRVTS